MSELAILWNQPGPEMGPVGHVVVSKCEVMEDWMIWDFMLF